MKKLFDETRVSSMVLKNRLIRSAIWEKMADEDGRPTEDHFAFYDELAKGGVGTIISGCTFVMKDDQFYPGMLGMWDDSLITDYKKLTATVHAHDCNFIQQLACGGSQGIRGDEHLPVWSPSGVADLATDNVPTPMTHKDITTVVKAFAKTAERAKAAGFDGVQIHGAHGYLLGQFLSPYYNRRKDKYGGSIENRSRIFVEVYEAMRSTVGNDFPIWLKINSADYITDGATIDDCLYVCETLSKLGLNAVEISGGTGASGEFMTAPNINTPAKEAYHAKAAAHIADRLNIPIILVGGLRSPEIIERLLSTTALDYFSMARPLLAEPDLPNRWEQGDTRRARCISCNKCTQGDTGGNNCIHKEKFKAAAMKDQRQRSGK